jgi:hypothetical protein
MLKKSCDGVILESAKSFFSFFASTLVNLNTGTSLFLHDSIFVGQTGYGDLL